MLSGLTFFSLCSDASVTPAAPSKVSLRNLGAGLPRRVRRTCVLAAATALLAVACLPAPSSAAVEWVVQQVQVLHRHGSRSSVPSYNTTAICGATPCGYLNPEGETMMRNIGTFLRQRYTTDTTVVDAAFLASEDYNLDVVSTRSTDVLRTLQSADLLLAGLFPTASRLIPAIHTVPFAQDTLLNTFSQPWLALTYSFATAATQARMNPVVDSYFPNFADLTALGATLDSEGFCSDYAQRWNCVSMLWDIVAAKRVLGTLPALATQHYTDLQETIATFYRYMFYYDPSDEFVVQQGGRGQPFLQEVLKNIDDFVSGTNTFKVMHYSAHDITIAPVWGTLGDSSVNAVVPPFSQTFVLELVKHATDGTYGVRVLRGWPGQTPDTDFAFTWDEAWQLQCRDSTGANYNAAGNLCPLADFRRYVQWTAGTSALGRCLLDADTEAVLSCPTPAQELAGSVTLSAPCALYRAACPAYSCPSAYVLEAATLACSCSSASCLADSNTSSTATPVVVTVHLSGVSSGATAGIAVATFAVGALAATAVTMVVVALLRRRGGNGARSPTYVQKYSADGRPVNDNDMA